MFVHLMRRLAQVCQLVLLLEVPQARAIDLHAFKAVRLHLLHHFEAFGGVLVVAELKVAAGDLTLHPGRLLVYHRETLVSSDGIAAPVVCLQLVSLSEFAQEHDEVGGGVGHGLGLASGALVHLCEVSADLLAGGQNDSCIRFILILDGCRAGLVTFEPIGADLRLCGRVDAEWLHARIADEVRLIVERRVPLYGVG